MLLDSRFNDNSNHCKEGTFNVQIFFDREEGREREMMRIITTTYHTILYY